MASRKPKKGNSIDTFEIFSHAGLFDQIRAAQQSAPTLDLLCTELEQATPEFQRIDRDLHTLCPRPLAHTHNDDDILSGAHSKFLLHTLQAFNSVVGNVTNSYLQTIANIQGTRDLPLPAFLASLDSSADVKAATDAAALPQRIREMVELYVTSRLHIPSILKQIRSRSDDYNKLLRTLFVKKPDDEKSDSQRVLVVREDHQDDKIRYVKIPLVEGNPVLTHTLLDLVEVVPSHSEREVRSKRGKKKLIREVSAFAVDTAAEALLQLSHPTYVRYLQNPGSFFRGGAQLVDRLGRLFEHLEDTYTTFLRTTPLQVTALTPDGPITLEQILDKPFALRRDAQRFSQIDFTNCVQNPDDILPENRREKEYFEARQKLMDLLYKAMVSLSSSHDQDQREAVAKQTIVQAVPLKTTMIELQRSHTARRLRHDKTTDNEYYVGRQGRIGEFMFEREVTPEASIDRVIGASFDRAKHHIEEVLQTGGYPRLMRATAPGGKVKSNILLIGPYGCGKTELARAVCADPRVIGASVSVASALTAYMHESVNNVKRVYDAARRLHRDNNETKPVVLVLDEFDGWFAHSKFGGSTDTDMQQIENVLLEVLDGMGDYNGIVTMAMTNKPKEVPQGILRRFRYVDIVGKLTPDERVTLLRQYLERTLPLHPDVSQHYTRWAQLLDHAPGDVLRKVADEVHFALLPEYIRDHPRQAASLERLLARRERQGDTFTPRDYQWLKRRIGAYRIITPDHIDHAITTLLEQPQVRLQIDTAQKVYEEAESLMKDLSTQSPGFGLRRKNSLFESS